jgi:hypothetical protein
MADNPTRMVAFILEREVMESRWEDHRWQVHAVVPDMGGEQRTIVMSRDKIQRVYPGFTVTLFPDEAEGYYLNASSEAPSVFVSVRLDEGASEPYPFMATMSYNEAARWMDGGEKVERVPAWHDLAAWMGQWVEDNYRPEPKKRRRPESFVGKEGVLRAEGER